MVVCFADVGGIVDHLIVIFTFILKRPSYVQQECKSKYTTAKWNKMKKKKTEIPWSPKYQYQNRRKRQNRYP